MPKKHSRKSTPKEGTENGLNAEDVDLRLIKSPEIIEEICKRLSQGETLTSICIGEHMPEPRTVRLWQLEDEEVAAVIARARDIGFDAIAEQCLTISDNRDEDPQSRRVMVDTRLKLLAKWCHRRYGEKVELAHSGEVNSTVTVLTEARQKALIEKKRAAILRRGSKQPIGAN